GQHPAKVVVIKVKSNFNNAAANRLEVIEDTTDEALIGPEPVNRDVGDADRTVFVGDGGTNELAHVSVTAANVQVISCPCTHDCVLKAINVIEERRKANCRVEVGNAECARVIIQGRGITNGGVCSGDSIEEKRVLAKSVVAESVSVRKERTLAESIVEEAKWE